MDNPLLKPFGTPFDSVPFESLKPEHFKPAVLQLIEEAKQEIDAIVSNPAPPDFANTIAAMEYAGKRLNVASATFFNLDAAETNDDIQQLAQELSPILAAYSNDIMLNSGLFQRVKQVHDEADESTLTPEEVRLLDKTYKSFARNGALLSAEDKEKLREIDQQLATLTMKFSQHVLQETNAYQLHIQDQAQLAGLPDSIVAAAKSDAEKRGLDGWVFTLHFPSFVPFMKYAANRDLRRELYLASATRALKPNEYNNEGIVRDIVTLRDRRAKLLGFGTHADFVLQERMASSPALVLDFLQDLLQKAKPRALQEVAKLQALAETDGISSLMPYDHAYYAEKLREATFKLSEEALKPYFPLPQVLEAAFDAASRLYGLVFELRTDIPTYHPEVTVYEVLENGLHKALLYTDWHPREGKRAGAWMTAFRGQWKENGQQVRPHISIVCNFARPVGEVPSLLTFSEVTTLFHEFGHALHGILADTTFESLSGTNVYWDFVELPSQFMENYCYEKDFLRSFARHYQTGDPLPEQEIDKIVAAANFMEGYQTVRQLGFGLLDMAYHTGKLDNDTPIERFEKDTVRDTLLYPDVPGTAQSTSFSHIFAGGYSAGYYSYKWAEVLDADAFSYFKETGIFNPETAAKFKALLSSGGTIDPMTLYIQFRGRKPVPDALLKRAGLVE
ncbi:M3 family metallopeptidase [Parapedobacter sp. ISTM3]|uniref:M3 family metallopeptidase n=1 Tax=Parapedobacter sp. ISTM3 TaxID=2800130 RepID=UPI0019064B59|nr:M3 family metallopeptidase [Parapedobacter sp. ISTM3]MBK1440458.1 M3 family metallopeptidase [Parapedobacter sp. ISTM3]